MDPALLAQIMGAGQSGDRIGQQDQLIQQLLARRDAPMPQYRTGLGAAFGGIGSLIGQLRDNSRLGDLRAQREKMVGDLGNTRQSYAQAMMGAQTPTQDPPEMIQAPGYSHDAMEQERQQRLQQLGQVGILSGDPTMAKYGATATDPKAAMERMALEQAPKKFKLEQALEQQKLDAAGPQEALGGQTPNTFALLTGRGQVPKYAPNPVSGKLYDVHTGKEVQGSGGAGDAMSDKRLPKFQESFAKDMDPNAFRSGVLKGNQERANAADRLLALATDFQTGGPANLTPQQMTELSTSLATLIGGGSSGEGTRHELTPYTKGRSIANLVQWITDKPQGAEQQAFVQQMIDTAKREQAVAQGQIRSAQSQRFSGHLPYFSLFPDSAKSQMQSFGFDPAEVDLKTGKYSPKAAVRQSSHVPAFEQAPGSHPKDSAALEWAKAHPGDPRAAKILQLNGATQ